MDLALRIYNILAKGAQLKRIYIDSYYKGLTDLFSDDILDRTYFCFKLLDGTNNLKIDAIDISDLTMNLLSCPAVTGVKQCTCPLYKEFDYVAQEFLNMNLRNFHYKRLTFDFLFFYEHVHGVSYLEIELKDKILMNQELPSFTQHKQEDIQIMYQALNEAREIHKDAYLYNRRHETIEYMKYRFRKNEK